MSDAANTTIVFRGQGITITRKKIDRFWSKVARMGQDECWEWMGRIHNGYGTHSIKTSRVQAHRFAWLITSGEIPDGLLVCHKCDNPRCCNPAHLFIGTHLDNNRDRASKGRNGIRPFPRWMVGANNPNHKHPERVRGGNNPRAKISESDIPEIRARISSGESARIIGLDYGVSTTTIQKIKEGRTWAHV